MPKRVTLYVHDDVLAKLELVQNKSGLVNQLLKAYFEATEETIVTESPKKEAVWEK